MSGLSPTKKGMNFVQNSRENFWPLNSDKIFMHAFSRKQQNIHQDRSKQLFPSSNCIKRIEPIQFPRGREAFQIGITDEN